MDAQAIREAGWAEQNAKVGVLLDILSARFAAGVVTIATAKPSRFPASVENHPAFTAKFNAKLVALGMDAADRKHRGMVR